MKFSQEELGALLDLLVIEQANMQWALEQDRTWGKYTNLNKIEKQLPIITKLYNKFEKQERKKK